MKKDSIKRLVIIAGIGLIGLGIISFVYTRILKNPTQDNSNITKEPTLQINSTISTYTTPLPCPQQDKSGFIPCTLYISFNYTNTFKTDIEKTKSFIVEQLSFTGLSGIQLFVNPNKLLVEAVITTPYNQELSIGESIQQKIPSLITGYHRIKDSDTSSE